MKTKERTTTVYIAEDGRSFDTKTCCFDYERKLAYLEITGGKSSMQYVVGNYSRVDGKIVSGYFYKFNSNNRRNRPGRTSSLKYATKFNTFHEAYPNSVYGRVMTIETAKEVEEFLVVERTKKAEREQRYVKVFCEDRNPIAAGDYITDVGVSYWDGEYFDMENIQLYPLFWMQKINLTTRNI